MSTESWIDLWVEPDDIAEVERTTKGRGLIVTLKGGRRILLTKQRMRNFQRLKESGMYMRIKPTDEGMYIAGIVASEEFTPIPHRLLFEAVERYLRDELGIDVIETRYQKWFKRAGMFYVIDRLPLQYAGTDDILSYGILVTNANTTRDSIRVYPYAEILKCQNGLIGLNMLKRVRIVHRGRVEDVLKKVLDAVADSIRELQKLAISWKYKIERLELRKVHPLELTVWLQTMRDIVPKKYHSLLERSITFNVDKYGATELARFQTLSWLSRKMTNIKLQKELQKMAVSYLQ